MCVCDGSEPAVPERDKHIKPHCCVNYHRQMRLNCSQFDCYKATGITSNQRAAN